ncbi:hypothetical protein DOE63_00295 [Salmonella enterica subsp. diarizonae serovar 59:z10:-]|nr:hypothetical protein DOE63_00295 [Salmonella enterica subsp. diarizonae serovar 59:z10:-]
MWNYSRKCLLHPTFNSNSSGNIIYFIYKSFHAVFTFIVRQWFVIIFYCTNRDFINKKKLILIFYSILTLSQLIFYLNDNYHILALMSFILGIGSSVIPLIISSISNNENGSLYIGRIMAGVLIGILSSRFLSSEVGAVYGWKSIYILSSSAMLISLLFIYYYFPKSISTQKKSYKELFKNTKIDCNKHI